MSESVLRADRARHFEADRFRDRRSGRNRGSDPLMAASGQEVYTDFTRTLTDSEASRKTSIESHSEPVRTDRAWAIVNPVPA